MFIKKYKNNEYILAENIWVRNFVKDSAIPLDINNITDQNDYELMIANEIKNKTLSLPAIDEQKITAQKAVIVSDGYDFDNKQFIVNKFPSDVVIFGVNKTLKKWKANSENVKEGKKNINAYIVNNPYDSCINYFDKSQKYFPSCICSSKTNHQFIKKYNGKKYEYVSTRSEKFSSGKKSTVWTVDDYRNPVCAAINILSHFGISKLLLLCCDDSFKDQRPSAIPLPNGLWQYPQQIISHAVIDANLYWLTHQEDHEVVVKSHSSGEEYVNAAYITAAEAMEFFNE